MKKDRVFRCTRCGNIVQTNMSDKQVANFEDRCPDPKAPGGYWYCNYEELVPITQGGLKNEKIIKAD